MTVIAGVLYLIIVSLGAFLMVRGRSAGLSSPDLLACRLLTGFALFFIGFHVPGVLGLFIPGHWVNFSDASLVALAVASMGCVWVRWRSPRSVDVAPATRLSLPWFNGTTRFVAMVVGSGFVLVAGLLVIGFPRGFEANAYHLPSAVNFFRDGSLQIWDTGYLHTLPANASLWDGFWLRLLPERVVSLANLPFLALCVFILYRLCRYSGADQSAAGLVSCGVTTIPLFSFCATELGADVAGVAFALLAFWLVLSRPPVIPGWSVLAGAASGIAYGFKPLHLVTAMLVGFLILVGRAPAGTRPAPRARVAQLSSFVAGLTALAGVWLLRNQVELGNPFYPIPLGGLPALVGFTPAPDWPFDEFKHAEFEWVPATWQWLIYPWVEGHKLHQNFKFSSGLGPFFAAAVPVAWITWGIMLLLDQRRRRERGDGDRSTRVLYVCGSLIFLAWWVSGSRQPRYAMVGIAVLLPLSAVLIASSSGWLRRAYELTLGIGILFMLAVILAYVGVDESSLLTFGRLPTRAEVFEYPSRIDNLPSGSVILDLQGRPLHYELYGARLTNRVVSFPEAERLFREGDEWNLRPAEIRRLGISYAYVAGTPKLAPGCVHLEPEAQLDRNPFNLVPFDQPRILYRVSDDCPAAS